MKILRFDRSFQWIPSRFIRVRWFLSGCCYKPQWWLQRIRRGWSDNDIWNMDMVLAERIGQMLHALADQSSSYPMSMAEIVGEQQEQWTSETWKAYLHDLGSAFDTYVVLDTYDRENEQKREEVRATMRTLFDYFEALWD